MYHLHKPSRAAVLRELRDYTFITVGLFSYALAWVVFLLPYQISTGGTTGISAIIYYATGFPIQYSYFLINAVLMAFAFKILGPRFSIKTTYAIFMLTAMLEFLQWLIKDADGNFPLILGPGQDFMACLIGAVMCGIGLGIVFINNGSTGGTDIIAAIINKYRDVTLGRMIMLCDVFIISSCYFIFEDWRRVIFGFVTLFVIGFALDYVVNSARQSVQFFIFSKEYEKIADRINRDAHRGVTVLNGMGWYSKNEVKVLVVLANKRQSVEIFRLVKDIDPNAFVSQSSVIGVYGEGFDRIKVKAKKQKA
ncbi:MAG: YitT family protein [Bacteroides sp.]|nr:YitT family protein [Bacteroides sp.]